MDLFGRDEERAFNRAFDDYFATLVVFVQRLWIDDNHTAQTIVIDSFLDIRRKKKHSFRKDGILKLLAVTVKRDCIDYLRHHNKEVKKHRELEQWVFGQPFDAEDPLNDPLIIESEMFQKLRDGLQKLPLNQKEILGALLDGTLAKDIAKQRGIRDNTVSITKKNGILIWKKLMAGPGDLVLRGRTMASRCVSTTMLCYDQSGQAYRRSLIVLCKILWKHCPVCLLHLKYYLPITLVRPLPGLCWRG